MIRHTLSTASILVAMMAAAPQAATAATFVYSGAASASQEVPAVASPGRGFCDRDL